jgi:hypothetical protein
VTNLPEEDAYEANKERLSDHHNLTEFQLLEKVVVVVSDAARGTARPLLLLLGSMLLSTRLPRHSCHRRCPVSRLAGWPLLLPMELQGEGHQVRRPVQLDRKLAHRGFLAWFMFRIKFPIGVF